MARRRNLSIALAAITSLSVVLVPAAVPASAAPENSSNHSASSSTAVVAPTMFGRSATAVSPDSVPGAHQAGLTAQDASVLSYWTPERLASAVPYEAPEASTGAVRSAKESALAAPTGPEGSTPPAAPLVAQDFSARHEGAVSAPDGEAESQIRETAVTNFSKTNGKLFFNGYGSGNAYCSASALNTDTKRVIITAGHCLYDKGAWSQNVVFVPSYDARNFDPDPVGIWTVHTMRVFTSWINNHDYSHDVGMATLNNGGDNNQRIVDAVGGHGMYWNGSYFFNVSIFGYPSNKTNPNGRYTMWACWGTTFKSGRSNSKNGCAFGPGASGGPWLYDYDNASGLGYVRSVTSTWSPSSGQNWAPYFTGDMKVMKDATNGDW